MRVGSESRGTPADSGLALGVRAVVARGEEGRSTRPTPPVSAALRALFLTPVRGELAVDSDDVDSDDADAEVLAGLDGDAPESDELEELSDELLVEEESPDVSAYAAGAEASATPTPRVTARAPTRPMCLA
ncbi:MAG: hypothetical protein ACSLFA_22490 [Mycobacterium sp.]